LILFTNSSKGHWQGSKTKKITLNNNAEHPSRCSYFLPYGYHHGLATPFKYYIHLVLSLA
jgi:hypothetical protein